MPGEGETVKVPGQSFEHAVGGHAWSRVGCSRGAGAEDKCFYPKIPVTVTSGDDSGEAASDRKHATKVLIRNNVMHGFCVSILPQIEQDNHVYVR